MDWRMHDMLNAVDSHRTGRALHVEDALDPQHSIAMGMQQHRQPNAKARPIDLFRADPRDRAIGRRVVVTALMILMILMILMTAIL